MKNASNQVVTFSSDENLLDRIGLKYDSSTDELFVRGLGNYTGGTTSAATSLQEVINDNEFVTAAALNELNNTKLDASAATGFVTSGQVESQITSKNYVTSAQVETQITGKNYATVSQIPSVGDFFDAVEYDSSTTRINFKNGNTVKAYVDATPFIKDGMVSDVVIDTPTAGTHSGVECLVVSFNTDSEKAVIEIPLSDIFDPENYYNKNDVDAAIASAVTRLDGIIEDNEYVIATAINDLNTRKLDASAATDFVTSDEVQEIVNGMSNFVTSGDVNTMINQRNFASATALTELEQTVENNEYVTATALNQLNSDKLDVSAATEFISSGDIGNAKVFAGVCDAAATATSKNVTCTAFTSSDLVRGATILVTFDNTNSGAASALTMNVNSTGDYPIKKQYNAGVNNITSNAEFRVNVTYMFVFDGTNWVCMTLDYNNSYSLTTTALITDSASTTARLISGQRFKEAFDFYANTELSGYLPLSGGSLSADSSVQVAHESDADTNAQFGCYGLTVNHDGARTSYYMGGIDSGSYTYVFPSNKGGTFAMLSDIPAAVTESTVSGWGFIKSYTETDPTVPSWAKQSSKPTYTASEVGAAAATHSHTAAELPTASTSAYGITKLGTAAGTAAEGNHTHSAYVNPTVTNCAQTLSWNTTVTAATIGNTALTIKAMAKPTASDIGAAASTHSHTAADLPTASTSAYGVTKLGTAAGTAAEGNHTHSNYLTSAQVETQITGKGYITGYTETDPTVPSWAKQTNKPTYTAAEVGALSGITVNGTAATVSGSVAQLSVPVLPTVSSSDNGKVMMVVNGAWAAVMPTTVYTGENTPPSSLGNDGDIYLQTS